MMAFFSHIHSAADFELVFSTLKFVATKGTSSIGNYLLLLYILDVLEDDHKRNEEKKLQPKAAPIKQEASETIEPTSASSPKMQVEISK